MCLLLQQRGSFHHITALDQRFNYSSWLLINICKGGNHSGLLLQHILSNPTTNKPGFSHSSKSDDFLESSQMNWNFLDWTKQFPTPPPSGKFTINWPFWKVDSSLFKDFWFTVNVVLTVVNVIVSLHHILLHSSKRWQEVSYHNLYCKHGVHVRGSSQSNIWMRKHRPSGWGADCKMARRKHPENSKEFSMNFKQV